MKNGNPDTVSANPLDELSKDSGMAEMTKTHYKWTIQDEAIHRGNNYAEYMQDQLRALYEDGATTRSILKQAYQEGFLHGFEHKFDNTNYEEKE